MLFRLLLITLFLLLSIPAKTQVRVGAWRDHLPYSHCKKVVKIGSKIYCATSQNIFTYDTHDNSIQKLSKITGFSDMGITSMEYNAGKNILLIAYDNGNIDLMKGQTIINIPDILNRSMTGSKKVNDIYFRDNFAYLCYSFGIIVLDLDKIEIKDTYIVGESQGLEVLSLVADDYYFYAATPKGIFKADVNDPFLVNYLQWHRDITIPNNTSRFDHLVMVNGRIIANYSGNTDKSDTLFYLENNTWKRVGEGQNYFRYELRPAGNQLLVSDSHEVILFDENFSLKTIFSNLGFGYADPRSSLLDESGNIWSADNLSGLVLKPANSTNFRSIYPNGPLYDMVRDINYSNGSMYVTGGGLTSGWNNLFNRGNLFIFNQENWTTIHNEAVFDYLISIPDPNDPKTIYVGAWGTGIWVYKNGQFSVNYNDKNSSLQNEIPGDAYVRVGGLTFDQDHNLWVSNGGGGLAPNQISVMKNNGTWKNFSWKSQINCPIVGNIITDNNGRAWVFLYSSGSEGGIFVFDIKSALGASHDEDVQMIKFKPYTKLGDVINRLFCIAKDRDGSIWVGTEKGPVVYSSPESIFTGDTKGFQPTVPRNDGTDVADVVLGTESVTCIAIDGANRKWFGTEKAGVFLFSPDGTKEIYHFNTENSPLFSNSILSIGIQDQTGEVFIGTDHGIISFRANATAPNEDFTNVYVFPNPVRENYDGPVTITGLIENSIVKITDISGNLVYQTTSLGGQATWDGKTHGGRKVATGIYLVFCSNEDGSKTFVTKMLVIH